MIIYNVTVKIDKTVEEDWVKWMKLLHIPDVMDTGIFSSHKFCRLIDNLQGDDEGVTYCIQYFCNSLSDLHKYQVNFSPALQKEHNDKYAGKFVAFRTLLEVI